MAVSLPDGVYIRTLSANTGSKPTVRVYTWDPFTLSKLRAMLPGINIEASSSVMNSTELAQAVISDAFDYDVALLNIRDPQLYSLMDKGYLMDLRPFAELARLSERIYPVFLEPVTRERRLFALPASVSITTYGYDPDVLSRIGLTADQLPRDILSFLDFLGGWRADFGGFDGEILPAIGLDRRSVTHDMVTLYIDQHLMQGLPLSFDTPLFRRMMEKIDSLDYSYLSGLWDLIPQESRDVPKAVIQPFVDLGSLGRNRVSPASDGTREYPLSIGLTLTGNHLPLPGGLRHGHDPGKGPGGRCPGGGGVRPGGLDADSIPAALYGLWAVRLRKLPGKSAHHGGKRALLEGAGRESGRR